jgi:uncharacterized protein (TIGR02466 family)
MIDLHFPIPIYRDKISTNDVEILLDDIRKSSKIFPSNVNENHWSGFNHTELLFLHKKTKFQNLKKEIERHMDSFLHSLRWDREIQHFFIDRMWANIYLDQQTARRHFHPQGVISGVTYLQGSHEIVFYHPGLTPRPEFLFTQIEITEENQLNYNSIVYQINAFDIILFPSILLHKTRKKNSDESISLAFDISAKSDKNKYLPSYE